MSASSQYYSVTARVGVPHRHEVEVTVPLVGPAGATGPAGAAGASAWNDISGKPSTFAPSAHSSTHHTGGSDPLAPANIGAAKDFTEIEVGNSGTSTITLTTGQLPARVILFIDAATAPSATINLPTPDARQSGLVASIKVQVEGGTADTALITVVHNAVNLLSAYSLAEDEGSIDFRWDGYRWVYDANWLLRSSTGRVLELPTTSGTLALTESADNVFRVVGSSNATKKVAFEVDTLVSAATTRTLTVPNSSGTIALTAQLTDTQIFTSNGTWTKPAGAKLVHYLLIGGGGGGGSGRRSASTNSLGGGGGGAGGGITAGYVDPAFLGSTESITVGAGGTGAADSADNTNGASGTAGGESSFGSFIKARGGAAGGGGSSSAGAAGAATTLASIFYGTNASTAAGALGGGTTGATAVASVYLPTGGGGGGARGGNINYLGGKGGDIGQTNTGLTSAPSVAAGTNGPAGIRSQSSWAGTGGGGGSMSSDNAVLTGFSGGNGGLYGGGGGGGSGAGNSAGGSTAGGNGGDGIVVITTYF